MTTAAITPAQLTPDAPNRFPLPKPLTDHISWLSGKEEKEAWILAVAAGRFRLLSDEEVRADAHLETLRSIVLNGTSEDPIEPTSVLSTERSALPARLVRISLKPHASGWRLTAPKALQVLAPVDCDHNDLTLLLSAEGYWEIWQTQTLKRAASVPFSEAMSGSKASS